MKAKKINTFDKILQVAIELVTYWDSGFGPCNWIILKNVIICVFGIGALIFGSQSAVRDIINMYAIPANGTISANITNIANITNLTNITNGSS